ncbi:MAG: hypothetical protein ACR2HP_17690 [Ilumatobacteraceae bacterium]
MALAVIISCVIAGGTSSVGTAVAEQPSVTPPDPTLELRPEAGPGGAEVEVHGEGWDPDSTDIVATWGFLDDVMQSDLRIDDSGTLSGAVTIHDDAAVAAAQRVEICAVVGVGEPEDLSSQCQTTTFSIPRTLEVNPASGLRGAIVDVAGRMEGFGKPVDATINWQRDEISLGIATVAPDGSISGRVTIPAEAAVGVGTVAVCVPDADGAQCASAEFAVLKPTLEARPADVTAGEVSDLTGDGWCCPGSAVSVVVPSGAEWGEGEVDESGRLRATATVPIDATAGSVELVVCAGGDCQPAVLSVIVPAPTTARPTSAEPDSTSSAPTVPPTDPSSTPATAAPSTGRTDTTAINGGGGGGGGGPQASTIGAALLATVGAMAIWMLRRSRPARGRRSPLRVGRVVPRHDRGRQVIRGIGGPVVTLAAVIDISRGTTTVKEKRP